MRKIGYDSWGALLFVAVVLVVALSAAGPVAPPSSLVDASASEPAGLFSTTRLVRFQSALATLVVGLVGFAGVILTLFVNAKIGRQQQRASIQHETEAVQVALSVELEIIRESLSEDLPKLKQPPGGDQLLAIPRHRNIDSYKSYIPKLGLLTIEQLRKVQHAYLMIQDLSQRFTILAEKPIGEIHLILDQQYSDVVRRNYEQLIDLIDEAIDCLNVDHPS